MALNNKGNFRHGYYGTLTYKSWSCMKYRCQNPKIKLYKNISHCPRWDQFENFLADMGECPNGYSLDRIDGKGGYTKENCRWADRSTQAENRKTTHYFQHNGKKLMLKDWSKELNIPRSTLAQRIYVYHWPIEKALRNGGGVL